MASRFFIRFTAIAASICLHLLLIFFIKNSYNKNLEFFIPKNENLPIEKKEPEWSQTDTKKSKFTALIEFERESIIPEKKMNNPQSILVADQETNSKNFQIKENNINSIRTEKIQSQNQIQKKKPVQVKSMHQTTKISKPDMQQKKPPLTLAQFTSGFLKHIENNGNNQIITKDKKNAQISEEQLKQQRYAQKIGSCLQNSFKIHKKRFESIGNINQEMDVFLNLYPNGKIKQLTIAKTSGNIHLDQLTLFIFQDAASSFPPVPEYLLKTKNEYSILYTIGMDRYRW